MKHCHFLAFTFTAPGMFRPIFWIIYVTLYTVVLLVKFIHCVLLLKCKFYIFPFLMMFCCFSFGKVIFNDISTLHCLTFCLNGFTEIWLILYLLPFQLFVDIHKKLKILIVSFYIIISSNIVKTFQFVVPFIELHRFSKSFVCESYALVY